MLTRSGCGGRSPLPGRGRWQRQLLLVHPLPEPSRWLWTVVRCVLFLKQCAFKNTIYLLWLGSNIFMKVCVLSKQIPFVKYWKCFLVGVWGVCVFPIASSLRGFPGGSEGKESACNAGDLGSVPGLGRFPWRRLWQPTPVFLTGESPHGQRSLVGCSPVQFSCPVVSESLRPMDCRKTRFLDHHQLPEFTQTHMHWVGDAIQPSHPLSSPFPPAFNLSQHQGLFRWVRSSHQVAWVLEFHLQHRRFQWDSESLSSSLQSHGLQPFSHRGRLEQCEKGCSLGGRRVSDALD